MDISLFIRTKYTKWKDIKTHQNHLCTYLKYIHPKSHWKKSINTTLLAIAHAGNKGKGEEEIYHTSGPPLFIWYLLANTENEAHNTKNSKIIYSILKNKNGAEGKLFKKRVNSNKNTKNKGKGEKKSYLIPRKFRSYSENLAQELRCLVMIHLLRCTGLPCSPMKCKGIMGMVSNLTADYGSRCFSLSRMFLKSNSVTGYQ